jgi:hypothetical protein
MSEESRTQDRLVSELKERDECQEIEQKEKNREDVLYVYMNNKRNNSNIQLYGSTFRLIETHNHEVRYVSVLDDFYDAKIRIKVGRQQ